MTRKESFTMAIEAEIRAQMLYKSLAKAFRNPETSAVFQELTGLEETHEEYLRKQYAQEFGGEEPEIKAQESVSLSGLKLSEPLEVLEFAMSREALARDAYVSMAETSPDADVKQTLLSFAHQEEQHQEVIRSEMQRIQGAMIWFDPSELTGLMED